MVAAMISGKPIFLLVRTGIRKIMETSKLNKLSNPTVWLPAIGYKPSIIGTNWIRALNQEGSRPFLSRAFHACCTSSGMCVMFRKCPTSNVAPKGLPLAINAWDIHGINTKHPAAAAREQVFLENLWDRKTKRNGADNGMEFVIFTLTAKPASAAATKTSRECSLAWARTSTDKAVMPTAELKISFFRESQ